MSSLADHMELYVKRLLALSASGYLEIKRKELAGKFCCVPSQVNYVLKTRFTLEQGYLVESRRGGKGYLRIRKIDDGNRKLPGQFLKDLADGPISREQARGIIARLFEGKYISLRESKLMDAAVCCEGRPEGGIQQGELRSFLLRRMILVLLS